MTSEYSRYHRDDVQTGERYKQCPISGDWYLVTEWVEKDDGRVIALEKARVPADRVPDAERGVPADD